MPAGGGTGPYWFVLGTAKNFRCSLFQRVSLTPNQFYTNVCPDTDFCSQTSLCHRNRSRLGRRERHAWRTEPTRALQRGYPFPGCISTAETNHRPRGRGVESRGNKVCRLQQPKPKHRSTRFYILVYARGKEAPAASSSENISIPSSTGLERRPALLAAAALQAAASPADPGQRWGPQLGSAPSPTFQGPPPTGAVAQAREQNRGRTASTATTADETP